jgi:hypothetical protein
MPKKVDECVKALKEKGVDADKAWAICVSRFGGEDIEIEDDSEVAQMVEAAPC